MSVSATACVVCGASTTFSRKRGYAPMVCSKTCAAIMRDFVARANEPSSAERAGASFRKPGGIGEGSDG